MQLPPLMHVLANGVRKQVINRSAYTTKVKSVLERAKYQIKPKLRFKKNYLMNDVSMALWAKARSLHALGKDELAKQAYGQCIFMTCGRAWDPKGWFWSPAEDCAEQVQDLL